MFKDFVTVYSKGHVMTMPRGAALDYAADCFINKVECRIMYGIDTLVWLMF